MVTSESPLETRPQSVALIGLGPSIREYLTERSRKGSPFRVDEVWGVNTAHRSLKVDKIWAMDDLKRLEKRFPDWTCELRTETHPIITCKAYPNYPSAIEYPLDEVINCIKDDTFNTSVTYAIAYAIYTNVETLWIYGCDFWYPNAAIMESGLGAASYLLGIGRERGLHFKIPSTSTLLDSNTVQKIEGKVRRPLYGYDYNPQEVAEALRKGRKLPNMTYEQQEAIANQAYKPVSEEAKASLIKMADEGKINLKDEEFKLETN